MGYRTLCNWCGERLDGKENAELQVVVSRPAKTRLGREWAQEIRPTLHFCITPRVDYDRLGLEAPDDGERDAGSCYARAIAAIQGRKLNEPDLGMEWRLMPVDEVVLIDGSQVPDGAPLPDGPLRGKALMNEIRREPPPPLTRNHPIRYLDIAPGVDHALFRAGYTTVGDILDTPAAKLEAIPGVGPKTIQRITTKLRDYGIRFGGTGDREAVA